MKYVLYREHAFPKDKLICDRINSKGNITFIEDADVLYEILDRFVKKDYQILIKDNDLYLVRNNVSFVLCDYQSVINCKHLVILKDSLLSKISEEELVTKKQNSDITRTTKTNEKSHKNVLYALITSSTVALCAISLVSLLKTNAIKPVSGDDLSEPDSSKIKTEESVETQSNEEPFWRNITFSSLIDSQIKFDENGLAYLASKDDKKVIDDSTETVVEEPEITFEEKSHIIRERYYLTNDMLDTLLLDMCNGTMADVAFNSTDEALDYLYGTDERTYPEKMLIVMVRENLTYDQLDDICAGVIAEGGEYYDEGYRVASVGYNRYRSIAFNRSFGPGLYTQFFAPKQFTVFHGDKPYLKHKGWIDSPGYQGAIDMFFTRERSVDYLSFRGLGVKVPNDWVRYRPDTNIFGNHQDDSDVLKLDYEYVFEEEMAEDLALAEEENLTRELKS